MGDIGGCELIEGNIIRMSPTGWRHGKYERRLGSRLGDFVETRQLGEVLVGEVGIYIRRAPDTIRGADVLFISQQRLAQVTSASFLDAAPELVVAVLSPDDRWNDVQQKLNDYFSIGVIVVWVVNSFEKTVSAYRSLTEVQIFTESDTLAVEDILPGFNLPVAMLFVGE